MNLMNPAELVAANFHLQKLNSRIDDLVTVEGSASVSVIVSALTCTETQDEILEVVRAMATKSITKDIKFFQEQLKSAKVDLEASYIEKRLASCREARKGGFDYNPNALRITLGSPVAVSGTTGCPPIAAASVIPFSKVQGGQ